MYNRIIEELDTEKLVEYFTDICSDAYREDFIDSARVHGVDHAVNLINDACEKYWGEDKQDNDTSRFYR